MLPGLSPDLLIAGRRGDPLTKALLHFDGANGSQTFTDSSLTPHSFVSSGTPALTTAQSKFGGASCSIPAGGYIVAAHSADWEFGAGDFTVEWQEYPINYPSGSCIIARDGVATFGGGFLFGYVVPGNVSVYMTSNGASWDIANGVALGPVTAGAWVHRAIARQGNNFWTFSGGVVQANWSSSAAISASSAALSIGRAQSAATLQANIDELRISKGIARWTANFTPPTAAYS